MTNTTKKSDATPNQVANSTPAKKTNGYWAYKNKVKKEGYVKPPKKPTYYHSNMNSSTQRTLDQRKKDNENLRTYLDSQAKNNGYILGNRIFSLSMDIHNRVAQWEKYTRGTLGKYLEDSTNKVFELIFKANTIWNKHIKLDMMKEADIELKLINVHVRRAFYLKIIDAGIYYYLTDKTDEIGKILGGYINGKTEMDKEDVENEKFVKSQLGSHDRKSYEKCLIKPPVDKDKIELD